jgi:hypothetical protein
MQSFQFFLFIFQFVALVLVREVTLDVTAMLEPLRYSVVAATALYLCQAHMSVLLLSKEKRFQCKTVLTNQHGNKISTFVGMKRKG